jgi:hypothetical protein
VSTIVKRLPEPTRILADGQWRYRFDVETGEVTPFRIGTRLSQGERR